MDPQTIIRPNPRAVFRQLTDSSGVLLHLTSAAYHGVNPVGALIWGMLEPGTSFQALIDELHTQLEDPPSGIEAEVAEFLAELESRDLIELTAAPLP